jgi:competence protein ComEA
MKLRPLLLATALGALSFCATALEINTANEAELDSVRGLGPAATARILEAREKGPFKDWADVMARVKGIKAATATKLSNGGLTVNQQSFPPPGAEAKPP